MGILVITYLKRVPGTEPIGKIIFRFIFQEKILNNMESKVLKKLSWRVVNSAFFISNSY